MDEGPFRSRARPRFRSSNQAETKFVVQLPAEQPARMRTGVQAPFKPKRARLVFSIAPGRIEGPSHFTVPLLEQRGEEFLECYPKANSLIQRLKADAWDWHRCSGVSRSAACFGPNLYIPETLHRSSSSASPLTTPSPLFHSQIIIWSAIIRKTGISSLSSPRRKSSGNPVQGKVD